MADADPAAAPPKQLATRDDVAGWLGLPPGHFRLILQRLADSGLEPPLPIDHLYRPNVARLYPNTPEHRRQWEDWNAQRLLLTKALADKPPARETVTYRPSSARILWRNGTFRDYMERLAMFVTELRRCGDKSARYLRTVPNRRAHDARMQHHFNAPDAIIPAGAEVRAWPPYVLNLRWWARDLAERIHGADQALRPQLTPEDAGDWDAILTRTLGPDWPKVLTHCRRWPSAPPGRRERHGPTGAAKRR